MKFDAKKKHLTRNRPIRKLSTSFIVTLILMATFSLILVANASGKSNSNAAENSNAGGNGKSNAAENSNAGGNSNSNAAENSNAGGNSNSNAGGNDNTKDDNSKDKDDYKDDSAFWDWLTDVYNDEEITIIESDNPSNVPNKKEKKEASKNSEETGNNTIEFTTSILLKRVKVNKIKFILELKENAYKPFSKIPLSSMFFLHVL